ncbi:DUF2510 domain-containing protein [Microbacterium sp. 18062]|uniref:DUF2510 domain-containing protein n=1 Tax=Microbacterium sp. 18062 TaxID=2681410 RepID=UPI0013590690|nr:DUF2510 domain-containing protein [Microbacterium sp. 18062]
MTTPSSAPPGWYDAGVPGQLRWWDGTAWTTHVQPMPPASPLPPAQAASQAAAVAPVKRWTLLGQPRAVLPGWNLAGGVSVLVLCLPLLGISLIVLSFGAPAAAVGVFLMIVGLAGLGSVMLADTRAGTARLRQPATGDPAAARAAQVRSYALRGACTGAAALGAVVAAIAVAAQGGSALLPAIAIGLTAVSLAINAVTNVLMAVRTRDGRWAGSTR